MKKPLKLFLVPLITIAAAFPAAARAAQQSQQASASASAASSASASANAGPASADLASETVVNAQLTSSVDARKCHPGQEITAKTTEDVKQDGHVVLRKGTRLVGHVSETEVRTKDHAQSSVGIVFDDAVMKNGEQLPFHASIQALAQTQVATEAAVDDGGMMAGGAASAGAGATARGGLLGGTGSAAGSAAGSAGALAGGVDRSVGSVGGAVGGATSATGSVAGNVGGLDAAGRLTSSSRGVFGLQGLSLAGSASSATEGSLIVSSSRNVHLSSGTQMLLKVAAK
jgi:hypothetical protein